MSRTVYIRRSPAVVVVGADLIEEARQIERQKVLNDIRAGIGRIALRQPTRPGSYSTERRDAEAFRNDVAVLLDAMEAER